MRASSCGSVWSMALRLTWPLIPGWMSTLSLASRASAKSRSPTLTLLTTTLYVSVLPEALGLGSEAICCTGCGIVPRVGVTLAARKCPAAGPPLKVVGVQAASSSAARGAPTILCMLGLVYDGRMQAYYAK